MRQTEAKKEEACQTERRESHKARRGKQHQQNTITKTKYSEHEPKWTLKEETLGITPENKK